MILDFLYTLNFLEAFLLVGLFLSCSYQLFNSYFDNKWEDIFKPTNLFALLTLFYCVIGPIFSSAQGNGQLIYRNTDHRDFYQIGLIAAFLSYFSFQAGFNYKNNFLVKKFGVNKIKDYSFNKKNFLLLHRWGEFIFWITILLQFLVAGISFINKFRFIGSFKLTATSVFLQGSLNSYASSSVNFLIVSILLMFIALLNGSNERNKFILYLTLSTSLFLNLGFRWRLFMLYFPILLLYFFYKKIKPKFSWILILILSSTLLFGAFQITRQYGRGLRFDNKIIRNAKKQNYNLFGVALKSAFLDSNVFNTSSGVIDKTTSENSYVGFAPIANAIFLPIPRRIWPNKPAGEYLSDAYKKLYRYEKWEVGSASLGFAEYYISGGWIALLSLNFILGYYYKRLWIWFTLNFNDYFAQLNYSLYLAFLFILYSRGYLLQILFLYVSIFAPLLFCSYFWNKKINK